MKTKKNQQQVRVKISDVWYSVEILDIDSDPAKVLVDGVPVDVKIKEKLEADSGVDSDVEPKEKVETKSGMDSEAESEAKIGKLN